MAKEFTFKYIGNEITDEIREGLWNLVCICDNDFVPPLSARESTYQQSFTPIEGNVKPVNYFKELCKQDFVLAYDGDLMVGFLTFRQHYVCEHLAPIEESLYMTTMCILPEMRGNGLSSALYSYVEHTEAPRLGYKYVTTRSWSTNGAQMHSLPKRGYKLVKTLKDDRGPGVDTVYFALEI